MKVQQHNRNRRGGRNECKTHSVSVAHDEMMKGVGVALGGGATDCSGYDNLGAFPLSPNWKQTLVGALAVSSALGPPPFFLLG